MEKFETWLAKILISLYITYGLVYLTFFGAHAIFSVCCFASLVVCIGLIVRKYLVFLSISSMYLIIFGCSLYSGGMKSPILFWLFAVQITCVFYGQSSKKQFIISLIILFLFIALTSIFSLANEIDPKYINSIHILAIIGVTIYSFMISSYFVRMEKIKNEKIVFERELKNMQSIIKGINHEFGNVLNVFFAGIRSIKTQLGKGDEARVVQLLENLKTAALHADNIVKSFRNVSNLSSNEAVEFKLYGLIETIASLTKGQYMEHMQIINSVSSNVVLKCNQTIIFQVILNVFGNSLKANPKKVEFISEEDSSFYFLKICDDGDGIPDEKGFDPFKAGESRSNSTGLGLAIVQENLRKIGGSITIESQKKPTIFSIKIPKKQGALHDISR